MDEKQTEVYLVTCGEGPMSIIAAYTKQWLATAHSRTITGCGVVALQLLSMLPESVADSLGEDFDEALDTPVTNIAIPFDDVDLTGSSC